MDEKLQETPTWWEQKIFFWPEAGKYQVNIVFLPENSFKRNTEASLLLVVIQQPGANQAQVAALKR